MKEKPYRIFCTGFTTERFEINIPKYFANYQYFKLKLISASTNNTDNNLWLVCDNMYYDAIYGYDTYKYDKFMFNIGLVTNGYSVNQYVIMPYKDKITISLGTFNATTANSIQFILELKPINLN